MREIIRQDVLAKLPSLDVVVRTRSSAYSASFGELRSECSLVLEKLLAT